MFWAFMVFKGLNDNALFKIYMPAVFHKLLLSFWWNVLERPIEIMCYTFFSVSGDVISDLETNLATNGSSKIDLVSTIRSIVLGFSGFNNLVIAITTITITFIFIKYAYIIFADFFLQVKDNSVGSINTFVKKILISLIICLVSPTILINGFMFFSALGMSAYSGVGTNGLSDAEVVKISFLRDSLKYGISPTTYCDNKTAQTNFGSNASKEIELLGFPSVLKPNSDSKIEQDLYNTWCGEKLTYKKLDDSTLSYLGKWSGEYPAMVGQTLFDKVLQSDGDFFVGIGYTSREANLVSDTPMPPFVPLPKVTTGLRIAASIIGGIYPFVIIFATARNFVNLLSLILVMWLYVQAYINDNRGNAFKLYCQKIATVFLTQFFIVALFYISSSQLNNMQNNVTPSSVFMCLALTLVTLRGSSIISEIVNVGNIGTGLKLGSPRA